jgi:Tol biopolymer transport system component
MRSDGTDRQRLTDHAGSDTAPAWSPDGHWIAFQTEGDEDFTIYVMRADGSDLRQVTDSSPARAPVWSADGQWIMFGVSNNRIWRVRPDGSDLQPLTDPTGRQVSPAWSPDGRWIAFICRCPPDYHDHIYRMQPGGAPQLLLSLDSGRRGGAWNLVWSPDGQWIAYESSRDGNGEIYRARADGSAAQRLTDHPATDAYPAWSPPVDIPFRPALTLLSGASFLTAGTGFRPLRTVRRRAASFYSQGGS